MLAHAIDSLSTIVLISADRDFVYPLSILRLRRYHVILISPLSVHLSLKAQATRFVDWRSEVLGITDPESEQLQSPPLSSYSATSPSLHSQAYRYVPFQNSSTSSPAPVIPRHTYGNYIDDAVSNASTGPIGEIFSERSKISENNRETLIGACGTSWVPSPVTRDGNPHLVNGTSSTRPPPAINAVEESELCEDKSRNSSLTSTSRRKMVGHFPQNRRVTAWKNSLRKTSRSSSDTGDRLGSLQGQPRNVWETCRNTLGSLLTFKRRDLITECDVADFGGAGGPSSINPSFVRKSTSDLVSTQHSVECSLSVGGVCAAPKSEHSTASITHLLSSSIPCPNPEKSQIERHTIASATSTMLSELSTPKTAFSKLSIPHYDSLLALGNTAGRPVPSSEQAMTSVTPPSSPQHITVPSSTSTAQPTIIPQHFQVLVDELRSRYQNGDTHPDRSSVAVSIYKRDPRILERAGFTGKKAFARYTSAAADAGIIELTIPGKIAIGHKVKALPEATSAPCVAHSVPPLTTPAYEALATGSKYPVIQASHPDTTLASTSSSAVPPQFQSLIERLTRLQSKDVRRPFRSLVAIDLVREYPSTFTDAGVKDFEEYISLAVKAGIVELGGEGSRSWVSLRGS